MREDTLKNLAYQVSLRNACQVRILLEEGTDPNEPTGLPLWNAAIVGDAYIALLLLNYGAIVDIEVPFGYGGSGTTTALMCAAHFGHDDVILMLLEAGADVNYMVASAKTALSFAAKAGRTQVVQTLTQHHAFNTSPLPEELIQSNKIYEYQNYWVVQQRYRQLAIDLCGQNCFADAEPIYWQMTREVESCPPEWRYTEIVKLLNRLGCFYTDWNRFHLAEQVYHRLLVMHKADATHDQSPQPLTGLLDLLRKQEKYQNLGHLNKHLWVTYRRVLGSEHPHTLYALYNLAETYRAQLDHSRAELAFVTLLELQEKVLGPMHLKCIRTLDGLKTTYTRLDDKLKLESVYLRLIERRRLVVGRSHPERAQNINNLASLYGHQGRDKEAAYWYAELAGIYEDGSEPAKLKAARNNLDRLTRKLNPSAPLKKMPASSGYAIPAPPPPPTPKVFALNMESVQQKIVETEQVQELLRAQFVEEEVTPAVVTVTAAPADVVAEATETNPFKTLDTPHFALLNWLLRKPFWKMQDIEAVAKPLQLLANGALERLNDMALDMGEECIFEGDDPIEVNIALIRELLL